MTTTSNVATTRRKTYRVSRRRQMRKWLVAAFGRRRRAGQTGATRSKRYTRPDALERLLIVRMTAQGLSAREIGRQLRRDHHTITRHAAPSRLDDLASALALDGHYPEARAVLRQPDAGQDAPTTLALISELEELSRSGVRPLPPFLYT